MKTQKRTYFCDSGVFIAFFSDEVGRADVVEELLESARAGDVDFVVSTLIFVEVIKKKGAVGLTKKYEQAIVDLFDYPFFHFVDANRGICTDARHLIWQYPKLRPADSTHLASALFYAKHRPLDALFSYDADFTDLNQVITQKFPILNPFLEQLSLPLGGEESDPAEAETRVGPPAGVNANGADDPSNEGMVSETSVGRNDAGASAPGPKTST